jgi:hypothetical protein
MIVLSIVALATVAVVIVGISRVLWISRRGAGDTWVVVVASVALTAWATSVIVLGTTGWFDAGPTDTPPLGRAVGLALLAMAVLLAISPALRRLLSDQRRIIALHVWRYFGVVFLTLMILGRLPALFAVPAGIGDVLVGASARSVANAVSLPNGRRRAIIFNLLGLTDLVVALTLGITTNPGRAHLFDTLPSSEVLTRFPMVVVPAFLVPLAITLHAVSLWQLLANPWSE